MSPAASSVSNEDFLNACFGPEWGNAHTTGFACDPNEAGPRWAGDKFSRLSYRNTMPAMNAYFTISLFNDAPEDGKARRRKALFRATHVIVVDDVGTKVDGAMLDKLPPPSWRLETSPDNFQWGYILAVPETDAARVNALLDGMVAAGLCADGKDPGMKGVTRYVRLPQGKNTKAKYGPGGFTCVLAEWEPSRKFTMDELAAPWGIVLPAPGTMPAGTKRSRTTAAGHDPVLEALERWGMVQPERTGDGGFNIDCPWRSEHTGAADTGAAYWTGGGFKCHHGHCEQRGRGDILAWADATLRAELGYGLAALDFKGADKPALDAAWHTLATNRALTSRDVDLLARVPNRGEVDSLLNAAELILGVPAAPIRRALTRARNRRSREARQLYEQSRRPTDGEVVDLPADMAAPVSLGEAQAAMQAAIEAAFGGSKEVWAQ